LFTALEQLGSYVVGEILAEQLQTLLLKNQNTDQNQQ